MGESDQEIFGKFQRNAFARGFLLFPASSESSARLAVGPYSSITKTWHHTFFGPCQIWVDPRLNYATTRDNKFGVAVLGLCINPFDGAGSNQQVADGLYASLLAGEERFYDHVDQLSGSFVILYRINDKVRILQDCAATKPVYFHVGLTGELVVASHAALIGQTFGLKRDPRVTKVFGDAAYKSDPSRYLPGDITPFSGLKALSANTELLFDARAVRRFFPRGALAEREVGEDLVEQIADFFRRQADLLAKSGRPLMIATTAGRDSRLSLAAFAHAESARLFSFHYPRTGHLSEDVETARALALALGRPLETYDLSEYGDADFGKAFSATNPVGIWAAAALCYIREFPENAIHIRSTVSEIGRVFYAKRSTGKVSPDVLSSAYTVTKFGRSDFVVKSIAAFIKQSSFREDLFFNYNIFDMFYWEHRNSKWQNLLCQEAEMATDVFIPYNNRRLINLLLSVPERDRKAAKLHVQVTNLLRPDFSSIPYIS